MESAASPNIDIYEFVEQGMPVDSLSSERSDPILLRMLVEGLHTDITLSARGGSVRAHRTVLASVSPVFRAMFNSEWREAKEQLTASVHIPDMTIDALQLFLLMLYTTNETTGRSVSPKRISWPAGLPRQLRTAIAKHFREFHDAVRKYQVEERLETVLCAALARHLTPANCWHYLEVSEIARNPRGARLVCGHYVLGHFSDVVQSSESFLVAMKDNPKLVFRFIRGPEEEGARDAALKFLEDHIAATA